MNTKRILLVDDNEAIHADFHKVFEMPSIDTEMEDMELLLFNQVKTHQEPSPGYIIDSAFQGAEALERVKNAMNEGKPYALAFVDVRMPPGWNGVETIKHIWMADPNIQIVICTAYSDLSRDEIIQELGHSDNLLILKKPFDSIEVLQLASALTRKWQLKQEVQRHVENLERLINIRTADLTATLESIQEGILAISGDQKTISYNKNFLKLWGISETFSSKNNVISVFESLATKVEKSTLFINIMMALCVAPKTQSAKEWILLNGNTIEISARPRLIDQEIIGIAFSFRDITERKRMGLQLIHQTTHDTLTELPNRLLLIDRVQQAVYLAKRRGLLVAVLLADLDGFKNINDTLGHNIGDLILKMVATKLKDLVRESDTVCRFAGDEFAIILTSQSTEENILERANALCESLQVPFQVSEHRILITASMGISLYPKHGEDAETLLKNSSAALYYAKDLGRNRVQLYMNEYTQGTLVRAKMITALRTALERHELILHYQPVIELKSGKTHGVEALLRWNHPTLGLVQPDEFIPLAEETGLIIAIGEWVLKTACLQAVHWQRTVQSDLQVAVNISGLQLRQPNFVKLVARILKETHLKPSLLELEITETLLLNNTAEIALTMLELKKVGVSLAMDDFGTGYASLNYLKVFPFDKIKIDKSFIDGLPESDDDRAIVAAIIAMSSTLGTLVIVEGVEKQGQVESLRALQCKQVQGYYFSRPLDEKNCTAFLTKKIAPAKIKR